MWQAQRNPTTLVHPRGTSCIMHIRLVFLSPFSVNLDNKRIVYKQERKSIVVHKLLKKKCNFDSVPPVQTRL